MASAWHNLWNPWLQKYCPETLLLHEKFGKSSGTLPDCKFISRTAAATPSERRRRIESLTAALDSTDPDTRLAFGHTRTPPLLRRSPSRRSNDCIIDLQKGENLQTCKLYDMSKEHLETLIAILGKRLAKDSIRRSVSPSSTHDFFVTDKRSSSAAKRKWV